jgi:hypothetical protein
MGSPGFPDDGDKGGGLGNVSALTVKSMAGHVCMLSSYHGYPAVVMLKICLSLYNANTVITSECRVGAKSVGVHVFRMGDRAILWKPRKQAFTGIGQLQMQVNHAITVSVDGAGATPHCELEFCDEG